MTDPSLTLPDPVASPPPHSAPTPVASATPRVPTPPTPAELEWAHGLLQSLRDHMALRIIGQDGLIDALLIALLARGHILIESVPGLAKTTAAKTLASAVDVSFARIQCTPDLMPSDIVGTQIFSMATSEMTTQLGPVHAHIVLLDEINRSSAKTQSAMLQAMEERHVTIGGVDYPLPDPFLVIATQNPIEEEGTYVLPEAQMDRFLLKQVLPYPTPAEEFAIVGAHTDGAFARSLPPAPLRGETVGELAALAARVFVHPSVRSYIVDIVNTTRGGGPQPISALRSDVRLGASPRGALALLRAAQAHALLASHAYVTPDDVAAVRHAVLRHRIIRTYQAIARGVTTDSIIDAVFQAVPVP